MASLRKRYQERIEVGLTKDGPPVTTAPTGAAKLPEPAVDVKSPPEMLETKESPADIAGKNALRERLREMENAETLNRQAPQPQLAEEPQAPQQPTVEQIISGATIPERAKAWLRQHPEYVSDPVKNNTLVALHDVAKRQSGSEFTDAYFEKMEELLDLAPRGNGQVQHRPAPPVSAPAAPRYEAPPRQQQRSTVPMSAPPSREAPSMASGRVPSRRVPLTPEQIDAARFSGISVEEYERQLRKMEAMKAAGQIDDRR